jgi:uncharacterized protein YjiS (DUF1127 family)
MKTINFIVETTIETMQFYRAVMELYALSDEQLNELDLTRGEIPSVVFLAKYSDK